MNVLEKAEKALEYLKANEHSAKPHEIQTAAGTLGRCLGMLGSRPSFARHYANLIPSAVPTLLLLASNESAEVRLAGDEALNRAVVGAFAFHLHKTNIVLLNNIGSNRSARWIRAALSRICLGDIWLRPGVGKIRSQAQALFPTLCTIVKHTSEIQLIVEALESNLPRILNALAEYTTDEEISDLSKALLSHVETTEPAVRRGISTCVAHLCSHRETLLANLMANIFEKLWPMTSENTVVLGWFCVIKAIFQINDISKFAENDLFGVQDYLELYHLCMLYLEQATDHNIQNCAMECLATLLMSASTQYTRVLLESHPKTVQLDMREERKNHLKFILLMPKQVGAETWTLVHQFKVAQRAMARAMFGVSLKDRLRNEVIRQRTKVADIAQSQSNPTVTPSRFAPSSAAELREPLELSFTGALQLGSLIQLNTPSLSCEDLSFQTPDSPESETEELEMNTEQLSKDLTEKLQEYEESDHKDYEQVEPTHHDGYKINIGTLSDDDVPLKYCARLLTSKFLLTGNKGGLIHDRSIRVSVKSSALNCLSELLKLYPQAVTMYLDKDAELKNHNISGSSEGTDSQDNANEYVLERNVCYQDSMSESLSQDLLKSVESHTPSQRKDKEKSESEQKSSSKDVPSGILDGKNYAKSDLIASGMSQDTNVMTNSNFTTNSGMTGSNTGYPMTSSGDILSSSIDLDMKFDHFGESTTNLENVPSPFAKKKLCLKEDVVESIQELQLEESMETEFECQHISEIFTLLEGHSDPQIRGIVRVCIGNYLMSALEMSNGDYGRWKSLNLLPKDVNDSISVDILVDIVLKGLSDEIHSTVNHTLSSLITLSSALSNSVHWTLVVDILNALINVESNGYWLCRVNLCKLYEKLPYRKLFMLYPDYQRRSMQILHTLIRLLADQDYKVRNASSHAIAGVIPSIFPSSLDTPITMVTRVATLQTALLSFDDHQPALSLVRDTHFYSDLPEQLKGYGQLRSNRLSRGNERENINESLTVVVAMLMEKLMASNCIYFSQGILETLQTITQQYPPWHHIEAYTEQSILCFCLESLDYCNGTVAVRTILLDLCRMVYPVKIHNIMRHKTANRDIFERDAETTKKWQHLENDSVADLAEKFLQVTLKMLNLLVHLIEEVNPNVHLNKGGIALPGTPVRRKTQDTIQRKNSTTTENVDDKGSLKKKPVAATSLKANFAGHFFNEPYYMKFYESLRATYHNHKINLDPKGSVFYTFLRAVLNSLALQLELATEKEIGAVTEEILYYLKVILPLCGELSVYCITQLLKCLFGTNMINQYSDFMSITEKEEGAKTPCFFEDVLKINSLQSIDEDESRRSSVCSSASQKLFIDVNSKMAAEKQLLIAMENFAKNKSDRKWSTNKKELERYIRLFEPVVIQSLKTYTMQNDIPHHRQVLSLLNQLLTLRVNYCMLDSDQVFIGFLLKQLELIEQHEIPNCCDLVNSILMFLVQLSSSKHHSKQLIEIPKLIQLCDGLMASGAHAECIAGLEPVAVKVFSNMGVSSVLGRAQQQEAQATREVLFYMLQKTMHQEKVLNLVSVVLCLSQEHPESYYRWSELASDTILSLLAARSVELETPGCIGALERLFECVSTDALSEQSRVETLIRTLFQAPPENNAPAKQKLRYLASTLVLLRKYLVLIPESEVLLTVNDMKATSISPLSIFFNVKTDVDPLNVQNVNENCANLSPDVILVRFLFKTLTYAILEVENCYEDAKLHLDEVDDKVQNPRLMYSVCVNIIVHAKHMLHLTDGCLFPLTSKTGQSLLHNEQSGLNTGLYNPNENIPLDTLNSICLKAARVAPLLTIHWSHLLIRLNFLSHKYWQKLVGFTRKTPLYADNGDTKLLSVDVLQTACVFAYCEYFVENGLTEAIHLTWLLVNRIHILVNHVNSDMVLKLIHEVQERSGATALMLQAMAARCQNNLKDEFALNVYKMLTPCHESQSGPLIFFICRIIGKLEPSLGMRFAKLAVDRCKVIKDMQIEQINVQLTKEDVQIALELLQRDKAHTRYTNLVMELNSLASSVFDLSPLDLSQDRAINPQYIATTNVDSNWLMNQAKTRCCITDSTSQKVTKHMELARLLANIPREDLTTVMACPEFDRKLLSSCFKVACDSYLKEFVNITSVHDAKETERDNLKAQRQMKQQEMTSSIDSNKLNVVNSTLHVFKKSDNKESKSQFFIPISDESLKESFGNLEISDEETELLPPQLSDLYNVSILTFDRSLSDIIRLFPKQNRPLSQSENFNLKVEQTIDRYTRRCHQVFQDKLFYQEYMIIQTVMTGFLDALDRIIRSLDDVDCDLLNKCIENILPSTLAKNIATFSVISLQYLSFLIKNKCIVEFPVKSEVSFRINVNVTDNVIVDNVIQLTVKNVAKAISFDEIWSELNVDSNLNRSQSAISCLYAVVKYLVRDIKPLILQDYMKTPDDSPKPEMMIIGNKLVTLIEYWEQNFYLKQTNVLPRCCKTPIESLIISLSRLDIVSNIALIPPIAWPSVDCSSKNELQKFDLPLQALQDMDVLEAFLFRANLIGWSSKKQFEEMWVGLLGALQGNGAHWAVRGVTQLLLSTAPRARRDAVRHVPRGASHNHNPMQRLKNLLIGTSAYKLFDNVNLERIPLMNDDFDGYHCAQFNTEYLKLASDITEDASFRIKRELKRRKRNKGIDVNSCLQILMDVTTQMLEPKAPTGIAARVSLLNCIVECSYTFTLAQQWAWAGAALAAAPASANCAHYSTAARALLLALAHTLAVCQPTHDQHAMQELSSVHQKLLKSLASSYAPLRQAALQGCLLQLTGNPQLCSQMAPNPYHELVTQLNVVVRQYLGNNAKISLYEQSLYWTVLFTLVELGHPNLINLAVDFILNNPRHYCADLVVKGITTTLRQPVLPKDLKNSLIEKLLDNMKKYSEHHAVQILMVHLFSADNKLLSPRLTSDVSNMDPDVLMNSMERITLLYKILKQTRLIESKRIITEALKYFLRETLPPAATLSRVVIEFIETCKEAEKISKSVSRGRDLWVECAVLNAEVVFEVFETSITQDQLPVLSGWLFEALCHLLNDKISLPLLPYCLITLLVSASSNQFIRHLAPLSYYVLRVGFSNSASVDRNVGVLTEFSDGKMSFNDRRLLCVVALKSGFSRSQLERLKELCDTSDCLKDLMQCLEF